ncbi:Rv0909 family putative TA system antitoxin [Curtobacterium sp. BRD11]|uniref:Rv0909 family putative TA system antitoxin n=1 Tax=Curtobacterium sp. BRD11 TaxID=2962581 RepID=UPI0028811726|nr:Rv0909 family putative TA system antitoxin [Curtobacterium sp. BRD11]MDT0211488.1 Rv0909 family putative TA system antitoxin [Curtobacterium sp. BRD11]
MVHPSLSTVHLHATSLWTRRWTRTTDAGLGKAADAADKATGGGHGDQIDKAEHAADDKIGK